MCYLGVTWDRRLTFKKHTDLAMGRALRTAGALKSLARRVNGHKSANLLILYKTHLRPLLEYSAVLWADQNKSRVLRLEQIQQSMLAWALGTSVITEREEMNIVAGCLPLSERRRIAAVISLRKECLNMSEFGVRETLQDFGMASHDVGTASTWKLKKSRWKEYKRMLRLKPSTFREQSLSRAAVLELDLPETQSRVVG
jgi:hypothetical protein